MTSVETSTQQASKEDYVTKRKLRFLNFLIELATRDPEWNGQLKELTEQFGEAVPQ